MDNWHERFKDMKRGLKKLEGPGTNDQIAEIIGNTPASVKDATQPNKELPRWARLSVVLYERYIRDHVK